MEKQRKYKIIGYAFKAASLVISCFFPMWAIFEKFPIWSEDHGAGRSVGVGAILMCSVFLIIFRKTVVGALKEKLKLDHAPPIAIWLVLLIVSYILLFIANFLHDLTTVLWMGALGCALGNLMTFVGESFCARKIEEISEAKEEVNDNE